MGKDQTQVMLMFSDSLLLNFYTYTSDKNILGLLQNLQACDEILLFNQK